MDTTDTAAMEFYTGGSDTCISRGPEEKGVGERSLYEKVRFGSQSCRRSSSEQRVTQSDNVILTDSCPMDKGRDRNILQANAAVPLLACVCM